MMQGHEDDNEIIQLLETDKDIAKTAKYLIYHRSPLLWPNVA